MTTKFIKNLEKFKLITFDVTDTLLKFKQHPGIHYAAAAESIGYKNIDVDKIVAQFPSNFKRMNAKYPNFGGGKINWEKWWEMLVADIFESAGTPLGKDDAYDITDKLIDKFETDECWEIKDGVVELIEKIKESGKKIGIISNFDPRLKYLVQNMKLTKFDIIIASHEVGAAKPNRSVFDLALTLMDYHVLPNEALHIGNTPTLDYLAAKESEWFSVLITDGKNDWLEHKDQINENYTFHSLVDFMKRLENDDIEWEKSEKVQKSN